MSNPEPPRVLLVSENEQTRLELEWTAARVGDGAVVETIHDAAEAQDMLTLRIRSGTLPAILVVDLRKSALRGSGLIKWAAAAPALAPMLIIVIVASHASESFLELLGADLVVSRIPDAAKFRQLFGIARELMRNSPGEATELPPTRRLPPARPAPDDD